MLPNWEDRPITVANLLNPAFCGEIILKCSQAYNKNHFQNKELPFPLAFIVIPLILHKRTRDLLPQKSNRSLVDWIESNQEIKLQIPKLAKILIPYTKEAIMFLLIHKIIKIKESGEIELYSKTKRVNKKIDKEVIDCLKKAELVGKWFANSGDFKTIYISFGIKP